jgi:hypothetical protein
VRLYGFIGSRVCTWSYCSFAFANPLEHPLNGGQNINHPSNSRRSAVVHYRSQAMFRWDKNARDATCVAVLLLPLEVVLHTVSETRQVGIAAIPGVRCLGVGHPLLSFRGGGVEVRLLLRLIFPALRAGRRKPVVVFRRFDRSGNRAGGRANRFADAVNGTGSSGRRRCDNRAACRCQFQRCWAAL